MISSKFSSWSTLADSITCDSGVPKFHTVSWQQLESSTNPPTPCLHAHVPICLTHRYVHTFTKLLVHSIKICLESIAAAAAKLLQSCLTLCDPMDCSPPTEENYKLHYTWTQICKIKTSKEKKFQKKLPKRKRQTSYKGMRMSDISHFIINQSTFVFEVTFPSWENTDVSLRTWVIWMFHFSTI